MSERYSDIEWDPGQPWRLVVAYGCGCGCYQGDESEDDFKLFTCPKHESVRDEVARLRGIVCRLLRKHYGYGRKEETGEAWLLYAASPEALEVWAAFGIEDGMVKEDVLNRIMTEPLRAGGAIVSDRWHPGRERDDVTW